MPRWYKAIITGLLIGALGVLGGVVPFGFNLEENIGLDLMFRLRGFRHPPSNVVIVSLDKATVDALQLPANPYKWPRSLHANLIKNLVKKGASVIVFDMMFNEPSALDQDNLFAQAVREAGNVVLCQSLVKETVTLTDPDAKNKSEINIEKLIQPIHSLERSALATAPFPLPKIPVKVNQYWTFKTEAGDIPTLPVTAFQIFALDVYDQFIQMLEKISPSESVKLLPDKNTIIKNRLIEETMMMLRNLFTKHPMLVKKMIQEIQGSSILSSDAKKKRILKSLVEIYHGPKSRYLNFYGPPGTIEKISYYQVLKLGKSSASKDTNIDLKDKVVFVGISDNIQLGQRDGFFTVFSQPSGVDISGVEIAASALANLLEDNPVQPLVFPTYHLIIILWGILLSLICFFLPSILAAAGVIVIGVLYLITAVVQFKTTDIWYPVVIPLFFQMPVAYFSVTFWRFFETSRERKNIKKALEYYLPEREVIRLSKDIKNVKKNIQTVYGTCLFTDVEQYTSKTENLEPKELARLMNEYFGAVFKPIRQYGGFVSDIKGDSVLSIWATAEPDFNERKKACLAALDILSSVQHFKHFPDTLYLPTRIGLHSGFISLGSFGAENRYEYRPIGDIVNTASRIENLNRYLGTRILVSEEAIHQVDGLVTRKLGKFLLAGKSKAVTVYELMSRLEESDLHQKNLCAIFTEGLNLYNKRSWEEAINVFKEVAKTYKGDGVSKYYLNLCETYKVDPPGETWDGVVILETK